MNKYYFVETIAPSIIELLLDDTNEITKKRWKLRFVCVSVVVHMCRVVVGEKW